LEADYDMTARVVCQQPIVSLEQLAFLVHAVGKVLGLVYLMH